ncbi:hypothetical protein Q4E93_13715 [Flavitalea sp. BT771]|uniref:hypothetical protein n=1 Tax=Flavitalea sp. BT771 TaxID=3063329 RepID=UPI0026E3CF39|nr:hypothetical protein [Flavitalea sp. BT771]MDO6431656.1 hypothetical protein [Flavitalea sp. BT771]MDV6220564.1 hypothetical protein [Flavitalea sp. BT771]
MHYLEKLIAEEHSKQQCDRIVKYIGKDKLRFAELMRLFFKGEYRITQRAAWPVSNVVRLHPELITPYFKPLLDNLDKECLHVAVVRNTIRLLQDVDIPAKYQGRVMSQCFAYVAAPETPIAVKAFSLTVLQNLSQKYPDILPELKLLIEEQWDQAPPAFRSRARGILRSV